MAEKRRLEEERTRLQEQIRQKSDQLREYIIQLVAYKSLVHRNRELERRKGESLYIDLTKNKTKVFVVRYICLILNSKANFSLNTSL